ncbi:MULTISPECIES: hypothetical protein [Trichocoleus]|uniref:Uncharacterized protein n=1 Tax=Trichocoleus desertorum GB2-A4 TaxID=2933944 RepID=A0ABV0J8Z2_9CYAN|nr:MULTISPECIES: hypothetical protein [unclassified Trichocoleus]MBD1864623.1 hypothetical protein [Trichocoleus sp. FACHB-46]MBD2094116.1 hypothetical protein [Trichocoleus sp. FACHB-591]MBD2120602.1 hypothetical protein [Trichocoleus sp. FACHB-262]
MSTRFFVSVEEKTRLFHAELVKAGVEYQQASRVAKVLAQNQFEESLPPEEAQLTEEACRIWLQHRQRLNFIEQTLASFSAKPTTEISATKLTESNCKNCAGSNQSLG